jgi:hypothetical protein
MIEKNLVAAQLADSKQPHSSTQEQEHPQASSSSREGKIYDSPVIRPASAQPTSSGQQGD